MDWNAAAIRVTNLRWYEHAAIRNNKHSNRYTAFIRCACKEYKFADNEHKRHIIQLVLGATDLYPSDISLRHLLKVCWRNMRAEDKLAWSQRADVINGIPRVGLFLTLPANAPANSVEENRICLKQECTYIKIHVMQLLSRKYVPSSTQKLQINFPQKTRVGLQFYTAFTMSPYLRRRLFGERLAILPDDENMSVNLQSEPGYIHLGSIQRAEELLTCTDLCFARYHEVRTDYHFVMTSLASLVRTDGILIQGTYVGFELRTSEKKNTSVNFLKYLYVHTYL